MGGSRVRAGHRRRLEMSGQVGRSGLPSHGGGETLTGTWAQTGGRGRLCWTTGLGAAHLLPLCTQQLGCVSASRPRTPRLRTLALVAGSGCGGLHGARTGSVGESGRSLAVRGVSMAAVSVTRGSATQEQ